MILEGHKEIECESDKSDDDKVPPLKDCSDVEITYPIKREVLVIRRVLNMQVKEDDIDQQRENIFHTWCHIQNKICSMIIDRDSCYNIARTTPIRKLNLSIVKHY